MDRQRERQAVSRPAAHGRGDWMSITPKHWPSARIGITSWARVLASAGSAPGSCSISCERTIAPLRKALKLGIATCRDCAGKALPRDRLKRMLDKRLSVYHRGELACRFGLVRPLDICLSALVELANDVRGPAIDLERPIARPTPAVPK